MLHQIKLCLCVLTNTLFSAASASCLLGGGLDFKDDATAVDVRLDIVGHGRRLEFGNIDEAGYRSVLARLTRMKQLRKLSVAFLDVPDGGAVFPAGALEGLSNLTSVVIGNFGTNPVKVTSIAVWKNLPIEELGLNYLEVEDAGQISKFKRLESLHCTSGEMFRSAPDSLRLLDLKHVNIKDGMDLGKFPLLESLHLCHVKCSSVSGMESLANLESLSLHDVRIRDFSGLKAYRKLKHLELSYDKCCKCDFNVTDLAGLPLESLVLENVPLVEIRGLEESPLIDIRVNGAAIKSLNDICRLRKLERLDIVNTKIDAVDTKLVKERFPSLTTLWYSDSDSNPQCIEW